MDLLLSLLVAVIILGVISYIISALPLQAVVKNIAYLVLGVAVIIYLLRILGGAVIDLGSIALIVVGILVLALVFRALAGILTLVLAIGIIGFVALLALDAYQGGTAWHQVLDNLLGWLTGLAIAIAGVIGTFMASRSPR